jgi:hypothetical protein
MWKDFLKIHKRKLAGTGVIIVLAVTIFLVIWWALSKKNPQSQPQAKTPKKVRFQNVDSGDCMSFLPGKLPSIGSTSCDAATIFTLEEEPGSGHVFIKKDSNSCLDANTLGQYPVAVESNPCNTTIPGSRKFDLKPVDQGVQLKEFVLGQCLQPVSFGNYIASPCDPVSASNTFRLLQ